MSDCPDIAKAERGRTLAGWAGAWDTHALLVTFEDAVRAFQELPAETQQAVISSLMSGAALNGEEEKEEPGPARPL